MQDGRKHVETTKILLAASWTVAILFSALAIVFPICGVYSDGLQVVAPLAWAEVTAMNAFYIWKAKNENRAKYAQIFIEKLADKYGAEAAALFADTVLKD